MKIPEVWLYENYWGMGVCVSKKVKMECVRIRKVRILLASNSPRRKQLLALGGWAFEAQPADIDERPFPDERPWDYVLRLAQTKAKVIADNAPQDAIIIAADTTVVDSVEDEAGIPTPILLGKPANTEEAWGMLRQLRGRTHQVYTALAVYRTVDQLLYTDLCVTDVPMREYNDNEIEAYIASGDPFDKAGGYAIQHSGFHPVESLSGCYANVVGLPLCHLTRILKRFGIQPQNEIPTGCQAILQYECPVFGEILELPISR
jgi:septum formation protein